MSLMETSLAALASSIPGVVDVDDVVVRIADVTHDSRLVDAETMFVAVRGASTDGHRFVDAAVAAGAPAVMVEARSSAGVPEIVVTDTRAAMAHLARSVHGLPDTAMTMIGVTGTNGKTTVCSMVEAVARAAGRRVGVIGTLGARIDGVPVSLERTTPESTDLQRLLATMRDGGVDVVAMEVSSHAMALHRADGIAFDVTAFTNLSQDHLDFHHTMEAYFAEKRKLFEPDRTAAAVVCVDDPYGRQLADAVSVD
ncbi:MAG: UDP-N-acetylmuramoyl-L-alanyl-D-glutamate--2,6-diaminopimelate ligase, partial [Acidimicrobiia bacterium]|nr:UDP-N-acetylmuramoyl-L-alanyl-D-glutamate--2,6-diaminopimelate ligase [Acidimicrobiia bacterium]